jgi:hypothetical protein
VCLDICRIYHKDISGRLAYCGIRQHFPYSLVPPATKPLVYAVPVSEFWRYIPPRSACARLPRYRVEKQTVVFRHSPACPGLSGQQFFYPFPRLVAYIVPVNAFISFHASHFISFPLSSPHYLGQDKDEHAKTAEALKGAGVSVIASFSAGTAPYIIMDASNISWFAYYQ